MRYRNADRFQEKTTKKKEIHPIWRGVGFGMMVLIPIMAYVGADLLLTENLSRGWFPIPADLYSPFIEPFLYVRIILILIIIFVLYVLFQFITFLIFSLFGPSRYGPTDVPQVTYRRVRRNKR